MILIKLTLPVFLKNSFFRVKKGIYVFMQRHYVFLATREVLVSRFGRKDVPINTMDVIIIASIIPFHLMKQRPQQLALSLSRLYQGKTVVYYEIDFGRLSYRHEQIGDNLLITNSLFALKNQLKDKSISIIATGNIHIPKLFVALNIKYIDTIYDYYDNFDGYDSHILSSFFKTLYQYKKIICSAKLLEHQLIKNNYNQITYLPNGVNSSDWAISDINKLNTIKNDFFNSNQPVIGFYGGIEHWLDYDLIKFLIAKNKDKLFVFIGPDNENLLAKNGILEYENFQYLGYMPFHELKYYSYCFDVAIIPFKINSITNAVSPVKFFEYLIQGKPVVSTGFSEILSHQKYCLIGKTYESFNENVQVAYIKSKDRAYKERITRYASNFEWDNLVKKIFS